ncbi:MAG: lysophospholipase [Cellvibrionaceae bacterium]|nr:lysophospholipase [Cellvibrionaceae bacterium]
MKMIKNSLILVFILFGSLAFATEKNVRIDTGTGILEGTLLEAKGSQKVALIIAGSGATDRNGNNPILKNNSLKMLAEGLHNAGISSLRYDKRGVGRSIAAAVAESDLRFEHYVNDAKLWIDYLASNKQFSEITVMGHSEGSLIGMLAFQQSKADMFVSIAGPGEPIDKVLRKQFSGQAIAIQEESTHIMNELLKGKTIESVSSILMPSFRPSVQPYLISWFKYSPKEELSKLKKPILIVQGTTDLQIKVEQAEALKSTSPHARLVIIKGMNHVLKEAPANIQENLKTYSEPKLAIKPELIEAISTFVNGTNKAN